MDLGFIRIYLNVDFIMKSLDNVLSVESYDFCC